MSYHFNGVLSYVNTYYDDTGFTASNRSYNHEGVLTHVSIYSESTGRVISSNGYRNDGTLQYANTYYSNGSTRTYASYDSDGTTVLYWTCYDEESGDLEECTLSEHGVES